MSYAKTRSREQKSGFASSRLRVSLLLLLALVAAGAWLYYQSYKRIDIASYIPQNSIGFLAVDDWTRLSDEITRTNAWRDVSPAYGIWNRWNFLGLTARAIRTTGLGTSDLVVFSRAQSAFFVTSLEVNGDTVKPRFAVVTETYSLPWRLKSVIRARAPVVAQRVLGKAQEEATSYQGVEIRVFKSAESEARLFSSQIDGEWILANHPESMEAAIDTRQGRRSSIINDPDLARARNTFQDKGVSFGFVSAQGVSRLARFATNITTKHMLGENVLSENLENVTSELVSRISNGMAYSLKFREGMADETWLWMCPPEVTAQLKEGFKPGESESALLRLIPESATEVMLARVDDTGRALDSLETTISSRVGAAESFLFHRFLAGARQSLFGLKETDRARDIFGNDAAIVTLGPDPGEQIWLLSIADRTRLDASSEQFLSFGGARISRDMRSGYLMLVSSDERRGAIGFMDDVAVFGSREGVSRMLDAKTENKPIAATAAFKSSIRPQGPAALVSYSSSSGDVSRFFEILSHSLPKSGAKNDVESRVKDVPLSAGITRLDAEGFVVTVRSPIGSLGSFAGMIDRSRNTAEAARP